LKTNSVASSNPLYFTETGSGPPLLLVHGLAITGEMFEPIVESLAKRHCLVIPDLRGSGRSRDLPPPYSVKQQAADLCKLLDHLDISSTDALGYSHGGSVVQQLALDYPAKVNHLILSNTYAYNMASFREKIEGHVVPSLIRLFGMRLFVKFIVSLGLRQVPIERKERAEQVLKLFAEQDPKITAVLWKEAMVFDSRARLKEIRCPTLIVAGADDNAVPLHHAKMLHDGIAGSKLVVIEGADHALIWAHPDQLLEAVNAFLVDRI
jgi:pimeloyl-ACP methyl ester carboxylesterase